MTSWNGISLLAIVFGLPSLAILFGIYYFQEKIEQLEAEIHSLQTKIEELEEKFDELEPDNHFSSEY